MRNFGVFTSDLIALCRWLKGMTAGTITKEAQPLFEYLARVPIDEKQPLFESVNKGSTVLTGGALNLSTLA